MEKNIGMPPFRKNDVVQVISGKFKGRSGKILQVLAGRGMIVVEKVNLIKRHSKPNKQNPQGGIVEKEAPLFASKVLPVSSKTGKPMRFDKWLKTEGRKVEKTTKKKARK